MDARVRRAASSRFDVPLVFAGLLVISAVTVTFYAVFVLLERHVVSWAFRSFA
jgi:NitT/TauT family transport system permease protein